MNCLTWNRWHSLLIRTSSSKRRMNYCSSISTLFTTVHASPRVRNSSHVIEQATHLRKGQRFVGLDRSSTGVHERDVVFLRLEGFQRTTVSGKVLKKVEEERTDLLAVQQLR